MSQIPKGDLVIDRFMTFGKQIGTKNTDKATSTIVVVVNEANEVITAYPF